MRQFHQLLLATILFHVFNVTQVYAAQPPHIEVGFGTRDITPTRPIFLAGYAARRKPSDGIDTPLKVQALAFRSGEERFVIVSLDNCEVSRAFMAPVVTDLERQHGFEPGSVMVVSSHTHSAPILEQTLEVMAIMPEKDRDIVREYSERVRNELVAVVLESVQDLKPARLEHGTGEATFATNRRVYHPGGVNFGENPDGPVNWDVPVLRITDREGNLRGILYGYACHGTSIQGEGFFTVSGDYMAYARQHLEAMYPGVTAIYVTGMGADQNPSPRGSLMDAKRHGLELAGAVIEVLNKPMRRVDGALSYLYEEVELPFEPLPNRPELEADAKSADMHIRRRAGRFLKRLDAGEAVPRSIPLPMSVVRIGDDLTFLNMAGEVVVDYGIQFKRRFARDHPWLIGYAYEVPCYIPSIRILKEGGYEASSSLIYYGLYGPFKTEIEPRIAESMSSLMNRIR